MGLFILDQKNREIVGEREAARAAATREKAAHEEAEAITRFLIDDLLPEADPDRNPRDRNLTAVELRQRSSRQIEGNPLFAAHPALEASLRIEIGHICYKVGLTTVADAHLVSAVELPRRCSPPTIRPHWRPRKNWPTS